MERLETLAGARPCYYVLQAETAPEPASLRRLMRSRARLKKQNRELASAKVGAIEVLETRNLERSGQTQ